MRKAKTLLLLTLLVSKFISAQHYCDCDSVINDRTYTGYCLEFFDSKLNPPVKTKPRFSYIVFYAKGEKVNMYYGLPFLKTDKVYLNGVEVVDSDSVVLINGMVKVLDEQGREVDEFLYKNGFGIKDICQNRPFYKSKSKIFPLSEVVEFDYSTVPFKRHQTVYKDDGTVKHNEYARFIDGKYVGEWTDDLMTSDLLDFKGVPDKK